MQEIKFPYPQGHITIEAWSLTRNKLVRQPSEQIVSNIPERKEKQFLQHVSTALNLGINEVTDNLSG